MIIDRKITGVRYLACHPAIMCIKPGATGYLRTSYQTFSSILIKIDQVKLHALNARLIRKP